ncbi:MAG: hypothetical protein WBG46_08830 [Nonlabens sp.]
MLIAYGHGIIFKKIIGASGVGLALTVFLGFFNIQILSAIWVFFYGLGIEWTVVMLLLSLIGLTLNSREIRVDFLKLFRKKQGLNSPSTASYDQDKNLTQGLYNKIDQEIADNQDQKSFSGVEVTAMILVFLSIAYVASGSPYFIDNESYYIQTIKWLDQYGLVTGLSNLHIFLSQQSGFHILQSAMNFDYFYNRFNDLSGVYLFLGFVWSLGSSSRIIDLTTIFRRLFAVWFALGYLFSSAPSPDLAVYVISYMAIYYFLVLYEKIDEKILCVITLLVIQAIFIKVTCALMIILPVVLVVKHKLLRSTSMKIIASLSFLFAVFYVAKSFIVSGMPLYPLTTWAPIQTDWLLPVEIADFYSQLTYDQSFGISYLDANKYSFLEKLGFWLYHSGVEGYFNKITAACLVATLVYILFFKITFKFKIVLGVFILQSLLLLITSPQFRFFLNLMIPVGLLLFLIPLFRFIKINQKYITVITLFSGIVVVSGFLLASLASIKDGLTDNPLMKSKGASDGHFITPLKNSNGDYEYVLRFRESENSQPTSTFQFYDTPTSNFLFGTYDAPLPSVQQDMLELIESESGMMTVLRSSQLEDGFKSVPLQPYRID